VGSVINKIQNNIDATLNKIGSTVKVTLDGTEKTYKGTLVDPSVSRNFQNLPDWTSKAQFVIYISYRQFTLNGYVEADAKNISKVYYKGVEYTAMRAVPYGILQDSFAYILIGVSI